MFPILFCMYAYDKSSQLNYEDYCLPKVLQHTVLKIFCGLGPSSKCYQIGGWAMERAACSMKFIPGVNIVLSGHEAGATVVSVFTYTAYQVLAFIFS